MAKLIVVCGATGQLGGSVARRMLREEGWKVRCVTRNTSSGSAQALASLGAELAQATFDDVASLEAAFEGAHAIFAVTNTFDNFLELGAEKAAENEYQQMMNLALTASKVEGLEHFVLHTLPSGVKRAGEGYYCPHLDTKDRAAEDIKKTYPKLAKKSTYLWVGIFVSNFFTFPMLKPAEMPNSYGSHVWIQPYKGETNMMVSGDVQHNVGVFVAAILTKPEVSMSKITMVCSDVLPFKEMLAVWSEVTGRRATYIRCSAEEYEAIWGAYGKELALMFRVLEKQPDWTSPYKDDFVEAKDLGITPSDLMGLKASLEKDKDKL